MKLRPSSSLLFHGPCVLEVQRDFERNLFHLSLFSNDDARRSIVRWQIDHIRQYGSNEVAFKFQSGRYLSILEFAVHMLRNIPYVNY